jgi:heme-degrading monooxygenase HmoA
MESTMPAPGAAENTSSGLVHAATLQFKTAPFRAERFALGFLDAARMVLDYGARGYSFYRSEEDPERFVHISYWESKDGFDQWWFSLEMQRVRQDLQGTYNQPLVPHWHQVIDQR